MARYKITVTFTSNPIDDDFINFTDGTTTIYLVYKNTTSQPYHIPIQPSVANTVSATYGVFNQVYNLQGIWINNLNGLEWSIEGDWLAQPTVQVPPGVSTAVVESTVEPLSIIGYDISTNVDDPCGLVDITITANRDFNEIISPASAAGTFPDTSTYKVTGLLRAALWQFLIKSSDGIEAQGTKWAPDFLDTNYINISVANNSVVVNSTFSGLTLEYSIDNVVWQSSNTFNSLTAGDYTMYIRDQFTCKVTKSFTIEEGADGVITIPDPYFFYSDANPVRMAKREQWDDCTILKNDYNTLSCESTDRVVHTEKQRWRTCDVINLQFKNNYSDLEIVTSDNTGNPLTLTQKSNNLNNETAMDCQVTKLSDTTNGIYFLTGNVYDYDTLTPVDEYVLNGELPNWAEVGQVVTINNFNYTIVEISFNETLQVNQFVITGMLDEGANICKAVYNLFDYEIYEVAIVVSSHADPFNVQVSYDGELQYVSEMQYPDDYTDMLLKISYYMSYNTDMFYATGILPFIRLQKDLNNANSDRENESFETDTTSIQTKVSNYKVNVFKFLPVTKQIATKCMTIFSCDNININGVEYMCDSVDIEPLEESNLYVVTATVKVKDSGLTRDAIGTSNVTLSTLLKSGQGYIKI